MIDRSKPHLVFANDDFRIIMRARTHSGATPLFDIEKAHIDALGGKSWTTQMTISVPGSYWDNIAGNRTTNPYDNREMLAGWLLDKLANGWLTANPDGKLVAAGSFHMREKILAENYDMLHRRYEELKQKWTDAQKMAVAVDKAHHDQHDVVVRNLLKILLPSEDSL